MSEWHIAAVRPGTEVRSEAGWCPKMRGPKGGTAALMPGYLFVPAVESAQAWHDATALIGEGFVRFLGTDEDGLPNRGRSAEVEQLRALCDDDGFLVVPEPPAARGVLAGDRVEVDIAGAVKLGDVIFSRSGWVWAKIRALQGREFILKVRADAVRVVVAPAQMAVDVPRRRTRRGRKNGRSRLTA